MAKQKARVPQPKRPEPPRDRRSGLAFVIAAGALVVALGAYIALRPSAETPANPEGASPLEPAAQTSTGQAVAATGAPIAEPAAHDHAAQAASPPRAEPRKIGAKGPLPPLPMTGYAPPRPPQVVAAVYGFAARHPEVLQYVPCYCGCERSGHRANDNCFVKRRAASGEIEEWDDHGLG